jgi:hypothetical protein
MSLIDLEAAGRIHVEEMANARRTSPSFERRAVPTADDLAHERIAERRSLNGVEPGDTTMDLAHARLLAAQSERFREDRYQLADDLAAARAELRAMTADRDRWAERNRVLEAKLAAIREVVR